MRWLFVTIGLAAFAFIALVQLPQFELTSPPLETEGFGGVELSSEARTLLDRVKSQALQLVERQNRWQSVALLSGLLALAATAAATVWAGFKHRESRTNREDFLNKKITGIGALTAIATLASAGSDITSTALVAPLDESIMVLKAALVEVPAEIAADPGAESSILDALEITLAEHRL